MLTNYFRVAIRSLRRHAGFSAINVIGLAIGLASCLIILLFVFHELSFDRYHEHADRIYRVAWQDALGNRHARTPHPLAPTLAGEFADVEGAVRFRRSDEVVSHDGQAFREEDFYYVDPAVFEVFSFPFLVGDPATALADPNSVVITESTARKYFSTTDVLGRSLNVVGIGDCVITGVLRPIPATSHFTFDILASYVTRYPAGNPQAQAWDNFVTSTYVLLRKSSDRPGFERHLGSLAAEHLAGEDASIRFYVDPLVKLHLVPTSGDLGVPGNARQLTLFSSVAVLILLIACINFMGLTTAQASTRAREVGVRKSLGANRSQIIRQFLGESVLITGLAIVLAVLLVHVALPYFNSFVGKSIILALNVRFILIVLAGAVTIGLLAGCYPAFVQSAFRPAVALKGSPSAGSGSGGVLLRRVLVVAQFGLSTALIVGTLVIGQQLGYVESKDLGFRKDQIVVVELQSYQARMQYEALKTAVRANPAVLGVAASYHTPGRGLGRYRAEIEGVPGTVDVPTYIVDYDYIDMMGLEIESGRAFEEAFVTDSSQAFIVNEAAVSEYGWEEPLGKGIVWDGTKRGKVVGVVKDFHYQSLLDTVEPLLMHVDPEYFSRLSIRVRPGKMTAALASLEEVYGQFDADHPLMYSVLDEDFARYYDSTRRTGSIIRSATSLALFVACLGLFGLASFTARTRLKEIGVRKVLGASVPAIVALLSRDLARLVLVGVLVGSPLAYFATQRWLSGFAYHIRIGWGVFAAAATIALGVALLTVCFQAVKAARTDPVNVLRYE